MWFNIFKISIIFNVTATALGESLFTGISNVLRERTAAKSNGDVDLHLFAVLFTGVVDTFVNNTVLTARIPHTSISVDYDGVLRDKIVKFLIEHSKRTTTPFIKLLGKSYYLSDKKLVTWYEANKTCVDMGTSLISQEENDESTLLFRFLKVNFDRSWWVSIDLKHCPQDQLCPFLFDIELMDRLLNGTMNCTILKHFVCEK